MGDLTSAFSLHEMKLSSPTHCGSTLETTKRSQKVKYKRFVRGPIPLEWLSHVAKLSDKSLHVGIALWYLRYLTGSKTDKLSHKTLEIFNVSRWTARRALELMEGGGMVTVDSHAGRSPLVTIIDTEDTEACKTSHTVADAIQTPCNRASTFTHVNTLITRRF